MSITIPTPVLAYLAIGAALASRFAISPVAFVVIGLLWPIFVVLILVGQAINVWQAKHPPQPRK